MRLVETPENPAPSDAHVVSLRVSDTVRLRAARWTPKGTPRGTAVILGGRTEYIEKYFETIRDYLGRGFVVATMDWRGQGASSRLLPDPLKGHINNFAEFDEDLDIFMGQFLAEACPTPRIVIAHSMGGNIALRALQRRSGFFAAAILTAPMLAVKTAPVPRPVARVLAFAGSTVGLKTQYVPGGPGPRPETEVFEGNIVTTDPRRHARNIGVLKAAPELGLGRPTFGWLEAAYRSMAIVSEANYPERIETPVLLVSAGQDKIVHPGADLRLARRLPRGEFVLIGAAEHEILQERDLLRAAYHGHADTFLQRALQSGRAESVSRISA